MIFTSSGEHSHPPPTPSRTPKQLLDSIFNVICRLNDPTLTSSKCNVFQLYLKCISNILDTLLRNPALREFCQQYNKRSLIEIHQSLANQDKITALIYKQRLLNYPDGQSITGVEFEYHRHHKDNPNAVCYI